MGESGKSSFPKANSGTSVWFMSRIFVTFLGVLLVSFSWFGKLKGKPKIQADIVIGDNLWITDYRTCGVP